jgi:lipopolysaccharide export system permease protein
MFARRIVAKHVTKTTAMAMLGATAILSVLQILFTYLGELGSLKEGMALGMLYVMYCGGRRNISMRFYPLPR